MSDTVFPRYKFHGYVQGTKGTFDRLATELKLVLDPNSFLISSHPTPPPPTATRVAHAVKCGLQIPSHRRLCRPSREEKKNHRNQRNVWARLSPLSHLTGSCVLPFHKTLPQNGTAPHTCKQKAAWTDGETVDEGGWFMSWRQWVLPKKRKKAFIISQI